MWVFAGFEPFRVQSEVYHYVYHLSESSHEFISQLVPMLALVHLIAFIREH